MDSPFTVNRMAWKIRVDERGGQVDPAAGRLEHLLNEVADPPLVQDGGGELGPAVPGHEDAARGVDPAQSV